MRQILLIEDNPDISNLVALHLQDMGNSVDTSFNGTEGLKRAIAKPYDLIILDLMLPGLDGIEICKRLRNQENYTPILMLTAKSTELDRVLGLEMGADDYLTKPFSVRELLARVKAIFRRVDALHIEKPNHMDTQTVSFGELHIDADRRLVQLSDRIVELTAKEFDLLWHFAKHPGQVFNRNQLLDSVWGYGHDGYEHTVNSHINRLRAKIESKPSEPGFILTVWGVGYKFAERSA
ncbi:MAG: response regulator transcription factor [Gammaproteobacteria bacterium]|nr:response regulator transcription factor [Gammaproteobacteria bacterium]MDH5801806.1 response regulator transcription factor [Gammaproteobacteria bacterium]